MDTFIEPGQEWRLIFSYKRHRVLLGMEIKSREAVVQKDTRVLKELGSILGSKWLGGIVIYRGNEILRIDEPGTWALPSRRLFQP